MTVSASHSRSSIGSSSLSPEPDKQFMIDIMDDIFKEDSIEDVKNDSKDRRPSFAEMQSEDRVRRPSINVYQLEDSDHPDIKSIQNMVADMTFGDSNSD